MRQVFTDQAEKLIEDTFGESKSDYIRSVGEVMREKSDSNSMTLRYQTLEFPFFDTGYTVELIRNLQFCEDV